MGQLNEVKSMNQSNYLLCFVRFQIDFNLVLYDSRLNKASKTRVNRSDPYPQLLLVVRVRWSSAPAAALL